MSKQTDETTRGFRPSARRRNRIAAGVALGALAIGGNVLVYSSLDDTTTAVQAIENIPAGSQMSAEMFRAVDVDVDPSVPTLTVDQLPLIVGQYSRTRIFAGSLVVGVSFQEDPLVRLDKAIVAIEIDADLVPEGTRERSNLQIVTLDEEERPQSVPGRAITPPTLSESGQGVVSMSIEVDTTQAADVAVAKIVRIVLLPPEPDTVAGDAAASTTEDPEPIAPETETEPTDVETETVEVAPTEPVTTDPEPVATDTEESAPTTEPDVTTAPTTDGEG